MKRYIRSDSERIPEDAFINDTDVRYGLAKSTTSADLLEIYTYDPDPDVRWAVAENPHTSVASLIHLSDDPDMWPKIGVAKNPNTPADILYKLSEDTDVIASLLRNPKIPPELMVQLVSSERVANSETYCESAARNPATPPEALAILLDNYAANKKYWTTGILYWVMEHPNVTTELLERLANEFDDSSARYMLKRMQG